MPKCKKHNLTRAGLKDLRRKVQVLTEELEQKEWASEKTEKGVKILYKELEKKNKQLKKIDRLKSQFVSNVAHEFKTPLIIARNCIDLILTGYSGAVNPEQKQMLERGIRTLDRLIRLVRDLLDLAKIESGKMGMKREEVDMARLWKEIFATYEQELSKKKISLGEDVAPDTGSVWGDRDKINEVIINLLNNAIKYTPQEGRIGVRLGGGEKKIRFEISDNGPGIAKKYLGKIFDKFERVTAEKEEGTGLGLPIARDIVALHKGKIWVESEPGKGSKFIFTLPRSLRQKNRQKKGDRHEEKNTDSGR
jgi:signal transduction histidine kinase